MGIEIQYYYYGSDAEQTQYYDEGPLQVRRQISPINSSSINTDAIDAYRQGVEITQLKHFDNGIIKISAGEPGHFLKKNNFGMDKFYKKPGTPYQDIDYFDPIDFIEVQRDESYILVNLITFPIITDDLDHAENYQLNGIIEPLTIRSVASFYSINVPFEAHEVRGCLMGGNTDQNFASDQITSIYEFDVRYDNTIEHLDNDGYYKFDKSRLLPFNDNTNIANLITINSIDSSFIPAIINMTGSTENYISSNKRSATCGWDYNSNVTIGTDSIAFGGLSY